MGPHGIICRCICLRQCLTSICIELRSRIQTANSSMQLLPRVCAHEQHCAISFFHRTASLCDIFFLAFSVRAWSTVLMNCGLWISDFCSTTRGDLEFGNSVMWRSFLDQYLIVCNWNLRFSIQLQTCTVTSFFVSISRHSIYFATTVFGTVHMRVCMDVM